MEFFGSTIQEGNAMPKMVAIQGDREKRQKLKQIFEKIPTFAQQSKELCGVFGPMDI